MSHASLSPFVDVSSALLSSGYRVRFRASGSSMRPAICDGDVITVDPIDRACLTPGAVLVYRRMGRLFAHRLVGIETTGSGGPMFVCRGDAARACDAPVGADQILGEVSRVERTRRMETDRLVAALRQRLFEATDPARRMKALFAC